MKSIRRLLAAVVFLIAPLAWSNFNPHSRSWLSREEVVATAKLLQNISGSDAAPGAVIASPSRVSSDYYYHWVRDGALTMDAVVSFWAAAQSSVQRADHQQKIYDYISFSRGNQMAQTLTGQGEPKFNVDGTTFSGPWGRPQNDGPALRAITLIHYANLAIDRGQIDLVRRLLYDGKSPSRSVIKVDLEYVAHHWMEPNYDLWEEVKADHFYTRMVQKKALLRGADLARKPGDPGAARFYTEQAQAIDSTLDSFWDSGRGYLQASRNYRAGLNYKTSGLDTAVLLAALHGGIDDGRMDWNDKRVQRTLLALDAVFAKTYPLNKRGGPATALGRYPEDVYDGGGNSGGNPWVLTTLAAAEIEYRRALHCGADAASIFARGESYVQRVALHANEDGSLSEQIDKTSGYLVSARDLTWNYAAVLSTREARRQALSVCPNLSH